jgi:hypothetical protein
MADKPTTAAGYKSEQVELVRATCLYVATKLGDLMDDFVDRERITLSGQTIMGEQTTREVWVCGPGAYVVLKSIAFRLRGENKDSYDLYYLVRNYGAGTEDIASHLKPLLGDPSAQQAVDILKEDFRDHDGVGPRRVAEFIVGTADDEIQADVVGFIGQLLKAVDGR